MDSLIQLIQAEMLSDSEDDSERLAALYEQASPEQRKVVDDVLICLCGYSMPSLLAKLND